MKNNLRKILLSISLSLVLFISAAAISDSNISAKANTVIKNKNGKTIKVTKYNKDNSVREVVQYSYYNNGKRKMIRIYNSYSKKIYKKRVTTIYRSNGKAYKREYIFRSSNGTRTQTKIYSYNRKGQLRSNSYGSAKRVTYKYYSNNKVSSRTTYSYSSKGKLRNKKVVYYKKNAPKKTPPVKSCVYIAYDGWCVPKGYDDNQNGVKDEYEPYFYSSKQEALDDAKRLIDNGTIYGYAIYEFNNEKTGKPIWVLSVYKN